MHLTSEQLEHYVTGMHESIEINPLRSHLEECQKCSSALEREAQLELAILDFAKEADLCVACNQVTEATGCDHCGAIVEVRGYKIVDLIVQNSRGRIYLAIDPTGQRVALKELAFVQAPSAEDVEAVEREALILRTLDHPGIPSFVASFQEGKGINTRFYLAQEYIEGKSLEACMEERQYNEAEVRRIAKDVLEILVYLQSLSPMVFHRDIKPANLMVREDGSVVLVDFGAARSLGPTVSATLVGTFGYMPVEQLGGIIDSTSDVYALGASLCHVLTRREPWHLLQDRSLLEKMNVSPVLRTFIAKMVARDSDARFSTAAEALGRLHALSNAQQAQVRPGFFALLSAKRFVLGYALVMGLASVWAYSLVGDKAESPITSGEQEKVEDSTKKFVRIEGKTHIYPPADIAMELSRSGLDQVAGELSVCVSREGAVESVTIRESTGYPEYDNKFRTIAMRDWKYEPRTEPGCTQVTFVYKIR